jgi:hypothetical protein
MGGRFRAIYLGEANADTTELRAEVNDLPACTACVTWHAAIERGPDRTIGFFVDVNGSPAARYLIPAASLLDKEVSIHLRDLGLAVEAKVELSVRAVDGAGNMASQRHPGWP